ncbi:MAG: hypothetical protein Q9219_000838 [cf. Caloplaca sp. 3 TL-2023]
MKIIRVPATSANLGPGFDVLGLALRSASSDSERLSNLLELRIEELTEESLSSAPWNCELICRGEGSELLSSSVHENLVTQVALYVLRCNGQRAFPSPIRVILTNGIPLSRGLGSSAAAVVAGVMLGNEAGRLGLSKQRMFDYCLMIERHPDNIAPALFGGFIGAFVDTARITPPLSEVLPKLSPNADNSLLPVHKPPRALGCHHNYRLNPSIKAVVVVPAFHSETAAARSQLPQSYTREDVIFNLQRCALLPLLLGEESLRAAKISEAMQDRLHQPYRTNVIPGLDKVLLELQYAKHPGLLGAYLSGAGPAIMALATQNFETIAQAIITILSEAQQVRYDWQMLELDPEGATCTKHHGTA